MISPYALTISLHILGFAGCITGSLAKNILLRRPDLTQGHLRILRWLDKLTASATGVLILTGLTLLFALAKPTRIFTDSPAFWLKMLLFVVISGLVIGTKRTLKRATPPWTAPRRTRLSLMADLAGLPVLAGLGLYLAYGL